MNAASPSTLLLAFYGDDFTGSTDAMEALQWAGIRTLLFLHPPTAADLARFPDLRAFGVAGWSRSMSPVEMDTLRLRVAAEAADGRFELYKVTAKHEGPEGRKQHGFPDDEEMAA